MLSWTKALVLLLAVAVLAAPSSALATDAGSPTLIQDYAQREAQSADLEQFTGGWHGVVLTVLVVVLIVWLVLELMDSDDDGHVEHHEVPHIHP
jgi:hypothetical protein